MGKSKTDDADPVLPQDPQAWFSAQALDGNRVQMMSSGEETLEARLRLIQEAQRTIYISAYAFSPGKLVDRYVGALCAKVDAGVDVRLVIDWIDQADVMTLKVEAPQPSADLGRAMEGTIRSVCKVGGKVEFAAPGSLPNDGKVIDDVRKYT